MTKMPPSQQFDPKEIPYIGMINQSGWPSDGQPSYVAVVSAKSWRR